MSTPELTRINLMASAPFEQLAICHVHEGNPKSAMAYAGNNRMKYAPDTTLQIFSQPLVSTTIKRVWNLNSTFPAKEILTNEPLHLWSLKTQTPLLNY